MWRATSPHQVPLVVICIAVSNNPQETWIAAAIYNQEVHGIEQVLNVLEWMIKAIIMKSINIRVMMWLFISVILRRVPDTTPHEPGATDTIVRINRWIERIATKLQDWMYHKRNYSKSRTGSRQSSRPLMQTSKDRRISTAAICTLTILAASSYPVESGGAR